MESKNIVRKWERTGLLDEISDESKKEYVALELEYAAREAMKKKDEKIFEGTLLYLKNNNYFKD